MHTSRLLLGIWSVLTGLRTALAENETVENTDRRRMLCAGVYSKDDHGGPYDSHIEVNFDGQNDGSLSFVIFSYKDIDMLGAPTTYNGRTVQKYLCDNDAVATGLCSQEDYGKVIISKYNGEATSQIMTERIDLPHDPIRYNVSNTAYYCVATFPLSSTSMKYKAKVTFMNAYGYLPASQLPVLWYHIVQASAYLLLLIIWLMLYFRYRHDSLPVQKYITSLATFMIAEQLVVWGYYMNYNQHDMNVGSKVLLAFVAIMGAGRLALTLFLVLIVSMGYSVVFASLGPRMRWCRLLTFAEFAAATVYAIESYYQKPDDDSSLAYLTLIPVVVFTFVFYAWILLELGKTMTYLEGRKQYVKVSMYRKLWWILLGSALAILGFIIIESMCHVTQSFKDMVNEYWKKKWLLTDGWPNIVYFVAFLLVAFLWRPNVNNRQFAMSSQLAQSEQDAEEFEIGSLNGSEDEESSVFGQSHLGAEPIPRDEASAGKKGPLRSETVFDADANASLSNFGDSDDNNNHRDGPSRWTKLEDQSGFKK